ncbi:ImmA/IrrE family metallo-endopeptidase [Pseudomonas sp. NPDC089534]|uniref:ImmA/IrrE family metallo-endopeptidase n=1 Tax=Pseudomonas sp. NPDC089534 TaxID=3364468 RepID=UPI0037FF1CC4
MQIDRNITLLVLSGVTALALILTLGTSLSHSRRVELRENRFLQTIEKYKQMGLLENDLVIDGTLRYRLSLATLDYSEEKTFAVVKSELKKQQALMLQEPHNVERLLSFKEYVTALASRMTANSVFNGRVSVNEVPQKNQLNILFLSSDPDHILTGFENISCAFTGTSNVVLCNSKTVSRILDDFDHASENFSTAIATFDSSGSLTIDSLANGDILKQLLKQNFLTWLLGHEIGHVILHGNKVSSGSRPLHFDFVYDAKEREADAFVVHAVRADNTLQAAFPVILLEFIEQRYHKIYQEQYGSSAMVFPARNLPAEIISITATSYSMPLLVRAMRLMDQSIHDNPKALNQATYSVIDGRLAYVGSYKFTDYYEFLKTRVTILEKPSIQSSKIAIYLLTFGVAIALALLIHSQLLRKKSRRI